MFVLTCRNRARNLNSTRGSSFTPAGLRVSLVTKPRTVIQQRYRARNSAEYTVSGAKGSCETGLKDSRSICRPPRHVSSPPLLHPLVNLSPRQWHVNFRLDLLCDVILSFYVFHSQVILCWKYLGITVFSLSRKYHGSLQF